MLALFRRTLATNWRHVNEEEEQEDEQEEQEDEQEEDQEDNLTTGPSP